MSPTGNMPDASFQIAPIAYLNQEILLRDSINMQSGIILAVTVLNAAALALCILEDDNFAGAVLLYNAGAYFGSLNVRSACGKVIVIINQRKNTVQSYLSTLVTL